MYNGPQFKILTLFYRINIQDLFLKQKMVFKKDRFYSGNGYIAVKLKFVNRLNEPAK